MSYWHKAHSRRRRGDNWIEPVGNELALASRISLMDPSLVASIRPRFADPLVLTGEEKWPSKSTRMSASISPDPTHLGEREARVVKTAPSPHNRMDKMQENWPSRCLINKPWTLCLGYLILGWQIQFVFKQCKYCWILLDVLNKLQSERVWPLSEMFNLTVQINHLNVLIIN